jgi:hypothetical protein
MVPFNYPHKFRVEEIDKDRIRIKLPYRKRNLNHLKGLHACAMATLAEVSTGFLLISRLNPKKYRLILSKLDMEYHYQGKSAAYASFQIQPDWWETDVIQPIEKEGLINLPCEVKIIDADKNHLATGTAYWQIKSWEKVKTKV